MAVYLFFENSLYLHTVLTFLLYQVQPPDKYVSFFAEIHIAHLAVFCYRRVATGSCRLIPAQISLFLIKVLRLEKCNLYPTRQYRENMTEMNPLLADDNDKIPLVVSNIFVNIPKGKCTFPYAYLQKSIFHNFTVFNVKTLLSTWLSETISILLQE